jgi:hypothetical protein
MRGRGRWHVGENLAWGTLRRARPAAVVAAWLRSPSHRRIMLDPRYRVVGVGVVRGVPFPGPRHGRTYTADFGGGSARPAATNCVGEEGGDADEARVNGSDEDGPPRFSPAFYGRTITLDASLDGLEGRALPLAIEEVCDVPTALRREAAQLAGADGIALVRSTTVVRLSGKRLQGRAATAALGDADTAVLRVRLAQPRDWRADEEGGRLPTFTARRIKITD